MENSFFFSWKSDDANKKNTQNKKINEPNDILTNTYNRENEKKTYRERFGVDDDIPIKLRSHLYGLHPFSQVQSVDQITI